MKKFESKVIKALEQSGSDKQFRHNYASTYAKFLFGKEINNMLEIGIANHIPEKSSLWAWKEIFPQTNIYAVDIDHNKMISDDEKITTYVVDQSSEESLSDFKKKIGSTKFDYILDDGSHVFSHAKITFEQLFETLSDHGVYLIEDVVKTDNGWQQSVKNWEDYLPEVEGITFEIIDTKPELNDDSIIIVIRRK